MKINNKAVILAALVLTGPAHAAITVIDDDGNRDAAAGPNVTTTGFSSNDNGGWGSAGPYPQRTLLTVCCGLVVRVWGSGGVVVWCGAALSWVRVWSWGVVLLFVFGDMGVWWLCVIHIGSG